jgi:hypothetical protein
MLIFKENETKTGTTFLIENHFSIKMKTAGVYILEE